MDVPVLAVQQETYLQQLCADIGYCLEDLPRGMDDRDGWKMRSRKFVPEACLDVDINKLLLVQREKSRYFKMN